MKPTSAPHAETIASPAAEYVVVARRYRPQRFDELIGQQHVAQALAGAISASRVGHAYLFTGARGVGKTSAARILAKALDCIHGPTPTPCNECDICLSISSGDDVDVLEIDGASNRGIDEIRELRQNVNVRPSRARSKIYIIDEVHMLTREAFNALLKTLEEPPEHVKFIFCTTEVEKIPITILSRCQRFDFAGIQTPSIAERLVQITAAEGVTADREALEILARRAAGSMRDSQSLLEQLLSFGGTHIGVADVHRLLGTADDGRLVPLARALAERQAAAALTEVDAALGAGVDVGQLLEQLLGYYRDLLVAAVGAESTTFLYVPKQAQAQLREDARNLGVQTILASMQILDQTLARLRYSVHARTLAELAVVRIACLEDLDELAQLVEELRGAPAAAGQASSGLRPSMASTSAPASTLKKKAEPLTAPPSVEASPPSRSAQASPPGEPSVVESASLPAPSPPLDEAQFRGLWPQVLEELPGLTRSQLTEGLDVRFGLPIASCAPNRLVLGINEEYISKKAYLERPEQLAKLEKALVSVTGRAWQVVFEVNRSEQPDQPRPVAAAARPVGTRERMQEMSQHPLVRRTIELFDAHPLRVEEPDPGRPAGPVVRPEGSVEPK